jgi:hypothetical protein
MHAATTAGSDIKGHTSSGGAGTENFSLRLIIFVRNGIAS